MIIASYFCLFRSTFCFQYSRQERQWGRKKGVLQMTMCERDQVNLWTRLRCFISTGTGVLYPSSLWNVNFKIQKKSDQRLIIGILEKHGRETMGDSVYFAIESSGCLNTCVFSLRFILSGTLEINGETVLLHKSNQTTWNFLGLQHKHLWVEITGHNSSSRFVFLTFAGHYR